MQIRITGAEPLTVNEVSRNDEHGDPKTLLNFDDTCALLERWMGVDSQTRSYRWGTPEYDEEPSILIVIWVGPTGYLEVVDIDPFWDGHVTLNAYDLDTLEAAFEHNTVERVE